MKKIVSLLVAAVALSGCSDDFMEKENPEVNYDPSKVISIAPLATKGAMIGSESQMSSIGVFCSYTALTDWTTSSTPNKMFNRQLNRNGSGVWVYANNTPENWNATTANDRFTFFSYAPFATGNYDASGNPTGNGIVVNGNNTTAGIPSLTYTVPSNCANQPDLMVSVIQKNIRKSPSPVLLSMQHALTSVGFKMIGAGQQVSKITIKGVKSVGTLAVQGDSIQWTNVSGSSDLDVKINTGITLGPTGQQMNSVDGYMMMIPQTLGTNAKIVVTLQNGSTREATLNTQVWSAGKHVDYVMTITAQGMITISPATLTIPAGGEVWGAEIINVTCEDVIQSWTLTSTNSWLQLSANANGSGAGQTVTGQGTGIVYTQASANTGNTDRTTTITLSGGTVVTVTQIKKTDPSTYLNGGTSPASVVPYVGAFWKANQKGERIIRINMGSTAGNLGQWRASVAWMDAGWTNGDIVLSTDPTTDPNVDFTSIKTPGDAESYLVNSNQSVVAGTVAANGIVYFRVGLKTTFNATDAKPARYAVILLQYGGTPYKEQLLYLRQGHDPDYLMRTNETGTPNSTIASRPNAVRFTPYNLTATTMTSGGSLVALHPILSALNPGTFTQYPTQTGAFFQWASTLNPLVAYNPSIPNAQITDWTIAFPTQNWNEGLFPLRIGDTQEGCPAGYTLSYGTSVNFRRPNNGSTTVLVPTPNNPPAGSEILQSLWLAPPAALVSNALNFIWGYYADGFFDRRMLQTTSGGTYSAVGQTVAWGTNDVACSGGLMYNPVTNASLFFPASGIRSGGNPPNGKLDLTGVSGSY